METSWRVKTVWAIFLLCLVAAIPATAQTFTNLVSFDGANGNDPYNSSVVVGPNGNLYGTTLVGGTVGGTVFEITPAGVLTTIYNFCSQNGCTDGIVPFGGLTLGTDGNFYGTTNSGGANFAGTVYKITPSGTLTTVYSFCSQTNCADGQAPDAGLVEGANGNFYGTTSSGGAHSSGTIFEITTSGTLTTLYNFCSQTNCADGWTVYSALTRASNGKLYGVTLSGGASGFGTVFSITATGTLTTLHNFSGKDGQTPWGGLVQASDGNLYGTASSGGRTDNGIVFKMTKAGRLTKIHDFCLSAYCTDGAVPLGTLIQGSNGNLYGTTITGGANYRGTVFEITTAGVLTSLHSFAGTDGQSPYAGVVQDVSNGTLYGTTTLGGDSSCTTNGTGCGTVFSLVP
jgi:uncharacterized repeat protein (TIGR03803 family)